MDILKISVEWAKDEFFSSKFFILFGILFLIAVLGFWQLGKSEMAKAFIYPLAVCGCLLLLIGIGLSYTNHTRIHSFEVDSQANPSAFVDAEIDRSVKTIKEFELVVFKVIPLIMICAALVIVFVEKPFWRGIGISTIAMMIVILLIDSNAYARMKDYHKKLIEFKRQK